MSIPPRGPVLLVANHPNSLLDPMLVIAAARRSVRLLAKAPLFTDAKVGWLMRASGSIPVYRRSDDPSQVVRNNEMFEAVHQALANGDAVGIFPEGISHNDSSLAPIKTGAARIALGAAAEMGLGAFPILPVGLVFRGKGTFRSQCQVIVGEPVGWQDLSSRTVEDEEAVRELTERIDASLRGVTVNLASWHDQPLVEAAVQIWEAEHQVGVDAAERTARLSATTTILAKVREEDDPEGLALINDVSRHRRRLRRVGLRPGDLGADVGLRRGAGWLAKKLPLVLPLAAIVGFVGWLLFLVPYLLTAQVLKFVKLDADVLSTWKLMVGMVLYTVWLSVMVVVGTSLWGAPAGILVVVLTPALGMIGLMIREQWRGSWNDVRRWFTLRSRGTLIESLRGDQDDIGHRLNSLATRHGIGAQE